MEYSSQSEDRWQNGRAGTPLRSLCAGGTSCIGRVSRVKRILLRADIHSAECPSQGIRTYSPDHGTVRIVLFSSHRRFLRDNRTDLSDT